MNPTTTDTAPMKETAMRNDTLTAMTELAGRLGLAAIFLLAGVNKLRAFEGTQTYMESMGVPGILLPAVIALEIIGAVAVIAGFQARLSALALAAFCVISAFLFHLDLADPMQFILFFKNVAMAGGFLLLAANGPGALSIDARRAL